MSEGSAIDDIMTVHVGCYVKRKEGGPSGEVLAIMGERARVNWGTQEGRKYENWEDLTGLVVSMTRKQVQELRERQKGMTYG